MVSATNCSSPNSWCPYGPLEHLHRLIYGRLQFFFATLLSAFAASVSFALVRHVFSHSFGERVWVTTGCKQRALARDSSNRGQPAKKRTARHGTRNASLLTRALKNHRYLQRFFAMLRSSSPITRRRAKLEQGYRQRCCVFSLCCQTLSLRCTRSA